MHGDNKIFHHYPADKNHQEQHLFWNPCGTWILQLVNVVDLLHFKGWLLSCCIKVLLSLCSMLGSFGNLVTLCMWSWSMISWCLLGFTLQMPAFGTCGLVPYKSLVSLDFFVANWTHNISHVTRIKFFGAIAQVTDCPWFLWKNVQKQFRKREHFTHVPILLVKECNPRATQYFLDTNLFFHD